MKKSILALLLVFVAIFAMAGGTLAQERVCSESTYTEHGIGALDYFIEGEQYVVTVEEDEWIFEYHYFYSEEHVQWEYDLWRYKKGCQGDLDFEFSQEKECETKDIAESWTKEVHITDELDESGEFTEETEDGGTRTVYWHVVAKYEEHWVIQYSFTGTAEFCQHHSEIPAPPTYSLIGVVSGIPGTPVYIGDTNDPDDNQTGYQCTLSSSTNNPDPGSSWNTNGVLDNSGNCWLAMVTESGPEAGKVTPNIWGSHRVGLVVLDPKGTAHIHFDITPGHTYLVILAYTLDGTLVGAQLQITPFGANEPSEVKNLPLG